MRTAISFGVMSVQHKPGRTIKGVGPLVDAPERTRGRAPLYIPSCACAEFLQEFMRDAV
jgi:hypothetical protein